MKQRSPMRRVASLQGDMMIGRVMTDGRMSGRIKYVSVSCNLPGSSVASTLSLDRLHTFWFLDSGRPSNASFAAAGMTSMSG